MIITAGVDEVGRGPLAGPVVTAAVIMTKRIDGVMDSKKLTDKKRKMLSLLILEHAEAYAFGRAEADEIDTLNIHHATLLAMKRAVDALKIKPNTLYVDGLYLPDTNIATSKAIVNGDSLIYEISAASIIAKVARDEEMARYDDLYPGYDFGKHKGYPTPYHREKLKLLGPCPIHRKSYAPVAMFL